MLGGCGGLGKGDGSNTVDDSDDGLGLHARPKDIWCVNTLHEIA